MNIKELEKFLQDHSQPKFRLRQIQKAIYQGGVSSFLDITSLPRELREQLDKEIKILSFEIVEILVAKDKKSAKALLKLSDNNFLETVLMSPKDGFWSVCVSSQVGCPLGCGFCATGEGRFKRNLTAEEITDQILFWRQRLKDSARDQYIEASSPYKGEGDKVTNIVYMGMGEPFLNWDNVKESLRVLTDKNLFGMGWRSISISTAGIPSGIEKLAAEFPQVNLAISLHFVTDEKRSKFMPINKKYNLSQLRDSLNNYFNRSNRKVFIEYIMLSKINDSLDDIQDLIKYIKSIGHSHLLHVNLIRYNGVSGNFKSSDQKTITFMKEYLLKNKINATVRKSLGASIFGACGQLAGKKKSGIINE